MTEVAGQGGEAALRAELERTRQQLATANRRAAGALASQQQLALAMETIRQKNAELDLLNTELARAREIDAGRAAELAASNARLHELVEQLSTPILRVGAGVLALPIVGSIDAERAATITSHALEALVSHRARRLILDLTGIASADARTLDHIVRLIGAARLVGADCLLCGLQPAVASALGELDCGPVAAVRELRDALAVPRRR